MDFEEYHIYSVIGAEQVQRLIDFDAERTSQQIKRHEWCKKMGGDSAMVRGDCMVCLLVPEERKELPGWKILNRQDGVPSGKVALVPITRTKLGKALEREMLSLRVGGADARAYCIGAGKSQLKYLESAHSMCMRNAQCWMIGQTNILIYPKDDKKPEAPRFAGCKLLKTSELYKIRESAEMPDEPTPSPSV